jgi:sugar phosphate isomerase/epimerase
MIKSRALSRRKFIQAAAGSAAAMCLSQGSQGLAAVNSGRWTIAIRDAHLKQTGETSCWAALDRLEVRGVEVQVNDDLACPGLFHPEKSYRIGSREDCKALAEELAARGITITALAMNNRLDERLDREVDWVRRTAEAAERLQVRSIRIDVVAHRLPKDEFLPFAIKACQQLCDAVKGAPVRLGIENHGHFTNDPAFLQKLFDGVNSDQLGLTLDVMNLYWFGHPLDSVYDICRQFATRAFHTHCKNLQYPADKRNVRRPIGWEYEKHAAPLDEGDIDYRRLSGILREANYQGDLCLENECLGRFPKDQHVAILKRELRLLRGL